jgi:hypothetical protein
LFLSSVKIIFTFLHEASSMNSNLTAFLSYAHFDNDHDNKFITNIVDYLNNELKAIGTSIDIFYDENIKPSEKWKEKISKEIENASILIPIITPSFFKSKYCLKEIEEFKQREAHSNQTKLIIPIYYINVPRDFINNFENSKKIIKIYDFIFDHQFVDFRELRRKQLNSISVRNRIKDLAILVKNISKNINLNENVNGSENMDKIIENGDQDICEFRERAKKLGSVGILSCDTRMKDGLDTETALSQVTNNFRVMAASGSKFVNAKNFADVVQKCGTNRKNVKFILADPVKHADTLRKRAKTMKNCMDEDHIIKSIRKNLGIMKEFQDYMEVKFYPDWFEPIIRALFVDGSFVLISFYIPGEFTSEAPQIKIIPMTNHRSFYRPFDDLFNNLWKIGTSVNWDDY